MIPIAITPEAFDAIAATLPVGSVGLGAATNERGERLIWLEAAVVDGFTAMRHILLGNLLKDCRVVVGR